MNISTIRLEITSESGINSESETTSLNSQSWCENTWLCESSLTAGHWRANRTHALNRFSRAKLIMGATMRATWKRFARRMRRQISCHSNDNKCVSAIASDSLRHMQMPSNVSLEYFAIPPLENGVIRVCTNKAQPHLVARNQFNTRSVWSLLDCVNRTLSSNSVSHEKLLCRY